MKTTSPKAAFTLIELSIVLVIIGLIVGGILVGRDLIRASQLRGPSQASHNSNIEACISPTDLFSTDKKIDDGKPLNDKILNDAWNASTSLAMYWNAAASSSVCTYGGANASDTAQQYNSTYNTLTCQPVFVW